MMSRYSFIVISCLMVSSCWAAAVTDPPPVPFNSFTDDILKEVYNLTITKHLDEHTVDPDKMLKGLTCSDLRVGHLSTLVRTGNSYLQTVGTNVHLVFPVSFTRLEANSPTCR
jgi:hypothetical protein